jgi:hypothetical protein
MGCEDDQREQNFREKLAAWKATQEAYWKYQWERNMNQDTINADYGRRLSSLERRVIWAAGAASGVGAVLGALVQFFLGR